MSRKPRQPTSERRERRKGKIVPLRPGSPLEPHGDEPQATFGVDLEEAAIIITNPDGSIERTKVDDDE